MKTKFKFLSIFALAICMVMSISIFATACSKVDYSTYTYEDYAARYDARLDKKDSISHQFYVDTFVGGDGPLAFLINLYADGSVLIYQSNLFTTEADGAHWYDEEYHLGWAWYGLWTETEDGLKVNYIGEKADAATTVSLEAGWQAGEDNKLAAGCYSIVIGKDADGAYALEGGKIVYGGMSNTKPHFPAAFANPIKDSIKFTTLKAYIDATLEGEADFPEV